MNTYPYHCEGSNKNRDEFSRAVVYRQRIVVRLGDDTMIEETG